jgi:hypothetical protein
MGGAVKSVQKPFQAVARAVSGAVGGKPQAQAPAPAPAPAAEVAKPVERRASRMDEEQGARMRGARRRGRSLLSDARLSAESGVETLGGGNNLG